MGYEFDRVDTCVVLAVEIANRANNDNNHWTDLMEHGWCELREWIIDHVSDACDACWEYADEEGYGGSFDSEFIHIWLDQFEIYAEDLAPGDPISQDVIDQINRNINLD